MVVIYAEKPDMGTKFAAALDAIHLSSGKTVQFEDIGKNDRAIKAQRTRDGYFKITLNGEECYVTWGFGHMCGLKQASDYNPEWKSWQKLPLPFIPDEYQLKLLDPESKQYKIVKSLFSKADLIINATDDDREGDLIFDYVYNYMGCKKPYKRILFNQQSKAEFIKAFKPENLVSSKDREPVIHAGRARSAGDFVVGSNLTVAMTLKNPGNKVLSVGRVQTAVLNMIVEREKAIKGFKPENYWVVSAKFTKNDGSVYEGIHKKKRFTKQLEAIAALDNAKKAPYAVVTSYEYKKEARQKPHLFSLQTLQMDANRAFGFSLSKTLEIAQSLYDKGYTTYPRTDSLYLTDDAGNEMEQVIEMLFNDPSYKHLRIPYTLDKHSRQYFDSRKVESHSAIVPTKKRAVSMTADESRIYDLIARSVICMVYPEAILGKTSVVTTSGGEDFTSSGTSVIEPGFFVVTGTPKFNDSIPVLEKDEHVDGQYSIAIKKTEPPKRYTDATLLSAMINCGKTMEEAELRKIMAGNGKPLGLGRPSSQASIGKTLEDRQYIYKDKKTIFPTEKGMDLIRVLPVEELKSAEMTARWELRLDEIAKGKDSYESFMSDLEDSTRKWTDLILNASETMATDTGLICPLCGKPMTDKGSGYGCSGYIKDDPDCCKFYISKTIAGRKMDIAQIKKICLTGKSDTLSGFKSKSGKSFSAALVLKDGKLEFSFPEASNTGLKCPMCGKPMADRGSGYGCTGYVKDDANCCKFYISKVIAGKTIGAAQVKKICEKGKSDVINGFKSKNGKKFSAALTLNKRTGQLEFSFDSSSAVLNCPLCGREMKDCGSGYGCTGYSKDNPDCCRFFLSKVIAGRKIDVVQAKKICGNGRSDVLSGFKSKSGKEFSAALVLNRESGRLEFEFD